MREGLQGEACWGVVLSRQGSSRLPCKALRPLGGKPLIAYTFEAARQAASLSRCFVFSDDPEVSLLAGVYGIERPPFERPSALSQSQTSTDETLRYFLSRFPPEDLPQRIVLLQPTSPFRTAQDIEQALFRFVQQPCDCLMSVTLPEKPAEWLYRSTPEGFLEPMLSASCQTWLPNGALYISRPQRLLAGEPLVSGKILPYDMPRARSIDIDTLEDFQQAEQQLETLNLRE